MDRYGKAKSSLRKPDIKPCYCTGAVKKQLSAVAGCSDDFAAVSALPVQWVPRHCGPTLTNYLKEREQNHHKTLEDLLSDAAKVNKDINAKIRDISEILLSHIKENQNDIDCVVQKFHLKRGVLSVEARNEALKEIDKLFTVRIQDLAKFKQEALGLERERVEGIRSTMKDKFQRLIAIGHETPKDLLHDFDDRMYEINVQLLSNSRAYIELEAQLRVQLEESIVRARSMLNQMCLKKSEIVRGRSALPWTKNQSSHKKSDNADDKIVDELGDSSQGVVVNIEEFNACVTQIVETYRKAILKVFSEFSSNLDDLQRDIGFHSLKTDKNRSSAVNLELDNMIGCATKRISDSSVQIKGSVYKDLEVMAHNDVLHMQQSLFSLGNCLRDTNKILFDASHIWDDHILRSAIVQKLTVAAVEDMQNIHDATELANEINFNITLEQLRYAPDVDKLQHSFDSALNLLKEISEMNLRHSESEISKLEEYMNLPAIIMAKVLLAECAVFLENHPKTVLERSGSFTSPAGVGSPNYRSAFSLRAPLPRAILQTELQEVALNNWKNGFIDSFVYNLPNVSQEMNRQARKWVDERRLQLNTRYSLKCMSHSIREERVKTARETRLAELVFHEERLNSHLAAIYNRTEGLPYKASSFLALDATELYPFSKWIKSIQTDMDDLLSRNPEQEVKKLKMMSYASRLVNHRKLFQESLDSAIEGYRKNLEHEIHVARIANFRFMSQLKLFFEGGRYAAGEATKTCAALVKAADALGACKQRCMDALNARRSQLLALADQQMLPTQRNVEEVWKSSKNGKKSLLLKKK